MFWGCMCDGATIGENQKWSLQAGIWGLVNWKEPDRAWGIYSQLLSERAESPVQGTGQSYFCDMRHVNAIFYVDNKLYLVVAF